MCAVAAKQRLFLPSGEKVGERMNIQYLLIVMMLILFLGVILTLVIGFSKENQSESSHYMHGSKRNLLLITGIYVLATAVFVAMLFLD